MNKKKKKMPNQVNNCFIGNHGKNRSNQGNQTQETKELHHYIRASPKD
jgi:hypothetical protein